MQPRISVIVPSLNQGRFIEETIKSLINQHYPDLEIIVVDGGSTDQTLDILKRYADFLQWTSEKDSGQSNAINKGFRQATGKIVTWLNSDDYYLPGTLHSVAEAFVGEPSASWVTGDYHIINENGEPFQFMVVWYKRWLRKLPSSQVLKIANYIVQPSTFWTREALGQIGFLDEQLHYTMDYDLWLRLVARFGQPIKLRQSLSAFRIHGQSKGGAQFEKQFREELQVLSRYTQSTIIKTLHAIHNNCIIAIYKTIKHRSED